MAFTYFFRDLQTLEAVRDHALPYLRTKRQIKIWDAGCAMGPEPYTLSIVLRESVGHMYFRNIKIHATDIDGSNLFGEIIQKAEYPKEQVERIPEELFTRYFVPGATEGYYRLAEEIRNSVSYRKHDLLTLVPPDNEYGLILCKNVLLHFQEEQRVEVMKMFHRTLVDGGFFVTEQTQKLPSELSGFFEPVLSNAQLFRKVS